jgi:fermentation-respiration switch protein FrsA (DUF1100 family)
MPSFPLPIVSDISINPPETALLKMIKELRRVCFICIAAYLVLVAFMFLSQRHFIYFPQTPRTQASDFDFAGIIEAVYVTTADNVDLKAFYVPPQGPYKKDKVFLYFHGNATWPPAAFPKMQSAIDAGYGILFAEYRGYAGNPSSPNELGLYHDAHAYLGWLQAKNITPNYIILYGESLGSGVATELATRHDFHALILETPFTSLPDAAKHTMSFIPFLNILMNDQYRSVEKVPYIKAPKLFLIAGRDEVIGAKTGWDLFTAAALPKEIKKFDDAGHNTVYAYGADVTVLDFLKDLE